MLASAAYHADGVQDFWIAVAVIFIILIFLLFRKLEKHQHHHSFRGDHPEFTHHQKHHLTRFLFFNADHAEYDPGHENPHHRRRYKYKINQKTGEPTRQFHPTVKKKNYKVVVENGKVRRKEVKEKKR
jgi:hypothetical protein